MNIFDISPLISPKLAVWPGDQHFRRDINMSLENGNNIDLSAIYTTVHLGAHADSPAHYVKGGESIEKLNLIPYIGPCQVMSVLIPRGDRIFTKDLPAKLHSPRLLLRTGSFPDPNYFNKDFNSLSAELVNFLADHGVLLVGIDTPSIDPFDDKILESHHALAKRGLRNLEGIVLDQVPDGLYTLSALPLKIEGSDASPVRAVLIQN